MIKTLVTAQLLLAIFASDCNSFKPVCGNNGVTYANNCKVQEAKADIAYNGPCNGAAPIKNEQQNNQPANFIPQIP